MISRDRGHVRPPSGAVSVSAVGCVQNDDGLSAFVDPVADAPFVSTSDGVLSFVLVAKGMTDPVGVVQQGTGDELGYGSCDLDGQPGELALCPRSDVEVPAIGRTGHAAPVQRKRWLNCWRNADSSRPGPFSPSPGTSPWAARSVASRRHQAVASPEASSSRRCHCSAATHPCEARQVPATSTIGFCALSCPAARRQPPAAVSRRRREALRLLRRAAPRAAPTGPAGSAGSGSRCGQPSARCAWAGLGWCASRPQ